MSLNALAHSMYFSKKYLRLTLFDCIIHILITSKGAAFGNITKKMKLRS